MTKQGHTLGMIGLGTMGRNLLLNMAGHGFSVAGFDKNQSQVEALHREGKRLPVTGYASLKEFVQALAVPRNVMLLVPAGKIVDEVIDEIAPLLANGDLIIDGGNSHFSDTDRRSVFLQTRGIHFIGTGISGGEEGARLGPSIMPGGDKEVYSRVQAVFESIAAKVGNEPCVAHMGNGSAGHFVKMVHNGIEYAIMQLIAESYDLMRKMLFLQDKEMQAVFQQWNEGRLQSYLIEITADIFKVEDLEKSGLLINYIKDQAKSKGTGKWTSQVAMDLGVPIPTLDVAVSMRNLSSFGTLRESLNLNRPHKPGSDKSSVLSDMEHALYVAMVTAYAQGMHLLFVASGAFDYQLDMKSIPSIWRGGCIIRSAFLRDVFDAYSREPALAHLYLDKTIGGHLKDSIAGLRRIVSMAALQGVGLPAHASALAYYDAIHSNALPTNLIQAQRDYFGAHTYERIDREGTFHSNWKPHKG